ncbi:insulinase family protein [Bacteriovoracaceae bacterium]|nr:insulinase family protein [Bacteriovoracaceae bacterium]
MKWQEINVFVLMFVLLSCSQKPVKDNSEEVKKIIVDQYGSSVINLDIHSFELENGLKVILNKKDELPIFALNIYYKIGGKNESEGLSGATHYLEHMMFKGAKKYKKGEFNKLVEGNGGSFNAYTTTDLTVYHVKMPIEHLETMLDIEADRMENLLLDEKAFALEKQVVLEEKKMRYENSDHGKMRRLYMETLFVDTPYEKPVIGTDKDIIGATRQQIFDYFKKYYGPNNAVLVISGNIDYNKTESLVKKYFGGLKRKNIDDEMISLNTTFKFSDKIKNRHIEKHQKGASPNPIFILAIPGVKMGEEESFVSDILSAVLSYGESSYLNQKLVKSNKAYMSQISTGNYSMMHTGAFVVSGTLLSGKKLKYLRKDILKNLNEACDEAITERNVQKIKNNYLHHIFRSFDTTDDITGFLGDREVYYGDYRFYKKEFKVYDAISTSDVKNYCKKLFKGKESVLVSFWNKNK